MRDEGGRMSERMRDEGWWMKKKSEYYSFIPHPSSLILHPSSLIPHPSSFILI